MAFIYDDVDTMLKPKKTCTFMVTGYKQTQQIAYFCHDCNPTMNETFCQFCIEKCHKDHHISKGKKLITFCHCGKHLHHTSDPIEGKITGQTGCTFFEFDEIVQNFNTNCCKLCKEKKICSWCVNFCHYHHKENIFKEAAPNISDVKCNCDDKCHKDDRYLFYYLKDFVQFRMEHFFNTHMANLLLEAPATSNRIFGPFNIKMKNYNSLLETGTFSFDFAAAKASSPFSRALMTISNIVKNIRLYYFSPQSRDELFPPKAIIELLLNNSFEESYDVRIVKKNFLFIMYKMQLCQDFQSYNKFHAMDYTNTTTIQRLELYNAVRNDKAIKQKYFDSHYNFRTATISLLEKYANFCKVDDHLSMALFSTTLSIVKLFMHYGCYNTLQIKMINIILETLFRNFKLEKTPKNSILI